MAANYYLQGHGYLEALTAPNVTVKTSAIESGLPTGLKLADGSLIEADAIVCATGFDTSFRPPFPVVGFDQDLRETWKDEPRSYLSIAAAGIPNYFSQCPRRRRTFLGWRC